MSTLNYPEIGTYKLPKKNVLVISCIDLRLTDNLVDFLNFDNLQNRYDHFALAGTSLTLAAPQIAQQPVVGNSVRSSKVSFDFKYDQLEKYNFFTPWKKTLFNHIDIAVQLHHIEDVYIIEHQDCGAYKEFLQNGKFVDEQKEKECHGHFAESLAGEITAVEHDYGKGKYHLKVHSFYIDLRGNVSLL